jgi:hypothetical protein
MFVKNRFILTGIFLTSSKTRKETGRGYLVVLTQKIGFQISLDRYPQCQISQINMYQNGTINIKTPLF